MILDIDIGTDVDDTLTLALITRSREMELQTIATPYDDVNLRARIALKILRIAGIEDLPVAVGI